MKKYETYLPIFPGFYNTIFDSELHEEMQLEDINQQRNELNLPNVNWDELEFNYKQFTEDVSNNACNAVESFLEDTLPIKISFQQLVSPKYYNYSNDSIHCVIRVNKSDILKIIEENKDEFIEYLQRYKSRSGFISYYPHKYEAWIELFNSGKKDSHLIGSALEFISTLVSDDPIRDIYEDTMQDIIIDVENYNELLK